MHVGGLLETRNQIAVASLHAYSIIINSSSAALYKNYARLLAAHAQPYCGYMRHYMHVHIVIS